MTAFAKRLLGITSVLLELDHLRRRASSFGERFEGQEAQPTDSNSFSARNGSHGVHIYIDDLTPG